MIDIIIPAYNAHNTIIRTLANLRIQSSINEATIYIVDDHSIKGYEYEINLFKNELNIIELKTPKNLGPGGARQFALDKSHGKFIVFLDADDQFYNPYSLNLLYTEIKNSRMNIVTSQQYIQNFGKDEINKESLHGKIYRRSFIEKHHLKFNNTRYSEDKSFNTIAINITTKIKALDHVSYLYFKNNDSLGKSKEDDENGLILYAYNSIWTVLELKKRNVKNHIIAKELLYCYLYLYKKTYVNYYANFSNLFTKCYRLEEQYLKYEKYMTTDMFNSNIILLFACNSEFYNSIINDFNNFRKKFNGGNNDRCYYTSI